MEYHSICLFNDSLYCLVSSLSNEGANIYRIKIDSESSKTQETWQLITKDVKGILRVLGNCIILIPESKNGWKYVDGDVEKFLEAPTDPMLEIREIV